MRPGGAVQAPSASSASSTPNCQASSTPSVMARFSALNPPISGERSRRSPKCPRISSSRPRSAALMRPTWMNRAAAGTAPPIGDRRQLDAGRQQRGKARAHRVADVDDRVLEPGQLEQPRLRVGVALHGLVVVEVIAAQVAECSDPHPHAVDALLVERVRGDLHRDVRRAGIRERAQLPVQRDDVGRRQRAARDVGREAGAERAEVGAAPREARGRRREEPGAGRLAVRARDARDREP